MWSKSLFICILEIFYESAIPKITLQTVSLLGNWKIKGFINATLCRVWPRVRRCMAGLRDIFSATTSYCHSLCTLSCY